METNRRRAFGLGPLPTEPVNTSGITRGPKTTAICRLCARTRPDHTFADLRTGICRFCMDEHSGGSGSQIQVLQALSSTAPSETDAGGHESNGSIYNSRNIQPTPHNGTPPAGNTRKGKRLKSTTVCVDRRTEQETDDSGDEGTRNSQDDSARQNHSDSQDSSGDQDDGVGQGGEDEVINTSHSRIRHFQKKKPKEQALQAYAKPSVLPLPKRGRGRPRKNNTQQSSSTLAVNTDLIELPDDLNSEFELLYEGTRKRAPRSQPLQVARAATSSTRAPSLVPTARIAANKTTIGRVAASKKDSDMRTRSSTLSRMDRPQTVKKTRRADVYTIID